MQTLQAVVRRFRDRRCVFRGQCYFRNTFGCGMVADAAEYQPMDAR
jgi:hypothetical protein